MKRPGYTLIEMLITITILSGLLIIVLGSFASSSSSSAKVSQLREKSQAARAIIDQISTDFRFIQMIKSFKVSGFGPPSGDNCGGGPEGGCRVVGFSVKNDGSEAIFMMHLPGDSTDRFVVKFYQLRQRNGNRGDWTIYLREGRNCLVPDSLNPASEPLNINSSLNNNNFCDYVSEPLDMLSPALILNKSPNFDSSFGGVPTVQAGQSTPKTSPTLQLNFTVKAADQANNDCSATTDSGTCYKVSTTLTAATQ